MSNSKYRFAFDASRTEFVEDRGWTSGPWYFNGTTGWVEAKTLKEISWELFFCLSEAGVRDLSSWEPCEFVEGRYTAQGSLPNPNRGEDDIIDVSLRIEECRAARHAADELNKERT